MSVGDNDYDDYYDSDSDLEDQDSSLADTDKVFEAIEERERSKSGIVVPENGHLTVYEDHLDLKDSFPIMRVPYYREKLSELANFDGFVARWYIPGEKLYFKKSSTTAIINVMIIDSAEEIKVGVGYDWTPVVLGRDEMQL